MRTDVEVQTEKVKEKLLKASIALREAAVTLREARHLQCISHVETIATHTEAYAALLKEMSDAR